MRVLIVEDDMVVAGCLGPIVSEARHELVGLAADRDTAVALLGAARVHVALVDLGLADGWTGLEVIRAAVRNGARAVAITGEARRLPPDMAGAVGVIEKPLPEAGLMAALAYLEATGAGEAAMPPSCLRLAAPSGRRAVPELRLAGAG